MSTRLFQPVAELVVEVLMRLLLFVSWATREIPSEFGLSDQLRHSRKDVPEGADVPALTPASEP